MRKTNRELQRIKKHNNERKRMAMQYVDRTYTKDSILDYLHKLFNGMAGWKYASISRAGSVFKNTGRMIIPVHLHKQLPTMNDDGKYVSEDLRIVTCIKLDVDYQEFEGIVLSNTGMIYEGDKGLDADTVYQAPAQYLVDTYNNIPMSEFSTNVEQEEMDKASIEYMETLHDSMEDINEKFKNLDISNMFDGTNSEAVQAINQAQDNAQQLLDDIQHCLPAKEIIDVTPMQPDVVVEDVNEETTE